MSCNSDAAPCPNHYTHPYHFTELTLNSGSNQQPYFRALVFFNKKPGITDDFFHAHWKSVHADLTMQTPDAGVNLARYVQFHQDAKHKHDMAPLIQASGGTMNFAPYDGCAEFHARTPGDFVEFMTGVYQSSHLVGCGKRFADMTHGYHIMVGYDNLIFGRGIPGFGFDGILEGDGRLKGKEGKGVGEHEKEDVDTKDDDVKNDEVKDE